MVDLPPGVADPRQSGLHRRQDVLHHGLWVNCATGHQPATCQGQTGIFNDRFGEVHKQQLRDSVADPFHCSVIRMQCITVKKGLAVFPSPAGMSLTKLSLCRNNLVIPGWGRENHRFYYSVLYTWWGPGSRSSSCSLLASKIQNLKQKLK